MSRMRSGGAVRWCQEAAATASSDPDAETRVVEIPVRYGGEHGPDIQDVAKLAELGSAEEVARAHSEGDYRVYFLGFTGGFPYLGGLPSALASVPRLDTPRQVVPKGAVVPLTVARFIQARGHRLPTVCPRPQHP